VADALKPLAGCDVVDGSLSMKVINPASGTPFVSVPRGLAASSQQSGIGDRQGRPAGMGGERARPASKANRSLCEFNSGECM
jgi:hypothetical protein